MKTLLKCSLGIVLFWNVSWAATDAQTYQQVLTNLQDKISPKGPASDATKAIAQIEGVYKYQFKNGTVDGSTYQSENILEIVRVNDNTIYFKTHLDFYNGHQCALHGVATYRQNKSFLFIDSELTYDNQICLLSIVPTEQGVQFKDLNEVCRTYCGARGAFNGIRFNYKQRRPIRYMNLILQSEDYKNSEKNLTTP